LTGASGVVGQGLLPRLRDADVVCLVHRTPVQHHDVTNVHGDLTQPRMGLSEAGYRALARKVDAVIHCGAVTHFARADDALQATNVEGTREVLDFVERAGATLLHVSTAFLHAEADGERGRTSVTYAASKRAGEELVRASRLRQVILRPSIVVGDTRTGHVSAFQGLYMVAGAIVSGLVPLIPFDPAWTIDFVPNDVVADAIATVLEAELTDAELWITAGEDAMRLDDAVALFTDLAAQWGVSVDRPRFVPPETFDRLIAPVFLDALPRRIRLTVLRLLDFFAAYLASDGPMPSSMAQLRRLGAVALPDPRATLVTSLDYWAAATGRIPARPQTQVA
jgi:nucleoside-diphosphate-sugar epimerase